VKMGAVVELLSRVLVGVWVLVGENQKDMISFNPDRFCGRLRLVSGFRGPVSRLGDIDSGWWRRVVGVATCDSLS
jgi:hypothetical protein